ncbi:putative sphingolipid C4-monooxygenase [Rosa chinensis]|uniref:Putative sphingolipid C4-monooxygenase n=1 Tax=Rosa chinensis TaxID=74649 RepID=A0A2P6PAH8_ROSCH|nr:putative sphingolipid C4-monooxygenase [Rosa chinensis]
MGIASDEILGMFIPIILYWLYAAVIISIEKLVPKYKLRSSEEQDKRNHLVSKGTVIKGVVLQQALQACTATLLYILTNRDNDAAASFLIAMVVMNTWQYFMHRYMHENKFLYKHVHSQHHRLVAPYAYGALYNHPLEGLLVDTMAGAVSFLVSGMSPRTSIFFFSFATIKAVDDHSGLFNFPWHPFHVLFENNSLYHDLHHQPSGIKYNYSRPFFVFWDKILGTYHMPMIPPSYEDAIWTVTK